MSFPSERILRSAIAFIGVLGFCVATYIFISDSTSGAPACLAGGGGCETVAKSSYSHIAGINVAIFGLIGEDEGQSPLAWQGGRLSREIALFAVEPNVALSR